MWYDSYVPHQLPTEALKEAHAAVVFARQMRRYYARQDRDPERRAADLKKAMDRVREAMRPIRGEIGRFPYGPQTTRAEANREEIRKASEALQRERRKLWKMTKKDRDESSS
jgi:hypothetical protein